MPHVIGGVSRWFVSTVLVAASIVSVAPSASADLNPSDGVPRTVSADALPTAQIDGVVWTQIVVGDIVYAGGNFATARPPGAPAGVNTVSRGNLMAYNIKTGELVNNFAPNLNGQVLGLAASPDGSRIYAVGEFTKANGANRYRFAAFSAANGSLVNLTPGFNARARAIVTDGDVIYVGGSFTNVSGVTRNRLVALRASNGAVLNWAPSAAGGGNQVMALALTPDKSTLVVGGNFTTLNSATALGLGAVSPATGATVPWSAAGVIKNAGVKSAITSLVAANSSVYGTGYVSGAEDGLPKGNLEGSFAAEANTGDVRWVNSCHGDSYSVFPHSGVAYSAGHPHDCRDIRGFPQTNPWTFARAFAVSDSATQTSRRNFVAGYFDWEGTPAPSELAWFPDLEAGTFTGQQQAAWSVTGNSDYVVFGGEFRRVNGVAQQGLVRFARAEVAPNKTAPALAGSDFAPAVVSPAAGVVTGSIQANFDPDNESLIHRVYREGSAQPILEREIKSRFYHRPMLTFRDDSVVPGQTYRYRVTATDPSGNTRSGDWAEVTASGSGSLTDYPAAVIADGPLFYWRFNESAPGDVSDSMGRLPGSAAGGITARVAGALAGDPNTAFSFGGGGSASRVNTATQVPDMQEFAAETWIKTTTAAGGRIIGFSNGTTGPSGKSDRHVYMRNDGRLVFGAMADTMQTIVTPKSYNDGKYHHVVAQLSGAGMELFVDGQKVAGDPDAYGAVEYNAYWRIGGDTLTGWPNRPSSDYFAGSIDEVALYPLALSADQITHHWNSAGSAGPPANQQPVAAFSAAAQALDVVFDATASADPDGSISSYSWQFGDGSVATGVSPSHTYAAAGTYPVRLIVTDNQGATAELTKSVTVSAPSAALAADTFARTIVNGWGTADSGGSWQLMGAATSFSVNPGAARIQVPTGQTRVAALTGIATTNAETNVTVAANLPTTSSYLSVIGRRVSTSHDYRAKLRFFPNGDVNVALVRVVNSAETTIAGGKIPGLVYTAGTPLRIKLQVAGSNPTSLKVKVWPEANPEPAGWTFQATDSTAALQGPGSVAFLGYVSSQSGGVTADLRFADLLVTQVP